MHLAGLCARLELPAATRAKLWHGDPHVERPLVDHRMLLEYGGRAELARLDDACRDLVAARTSANWPRRRASRRPRRGSFAEAVSATTAWPKRRRCEVLRSGGCKRRMARTPTPSTVLLGNRRALRRLSAQFLVQTVENSHPPLCREARGQARLLDAYRFHALPVAPRACARTIKWSATGGTSSSPPSNRRCVP